jgi:Ca2+-binding RTX toxin-like protein
MSVTLVNTATVFDSGALALSSAAGVTFAYVAGNPYLYVGGYGDSGISAFSVSAAGQLTNVAGPGGTVTDSASLAILGTAGLASLSIGGNSFLYATGFDEAGMGAFVLGSNGAMVSLAGAAGAVRDTDFGAYELLGATEAVAVTVEGAAYVIAAGFDDDGLSSFSIDPLTGGFTHVADFHVDDSGYTNFKLNSALWVETVVVEGTTYVLAAGQADSGVTIFTLNPAGTLNYHASLSDTPTTNLAGTRAVTSALVGGNTYIFAAGAIDNGVSVYLLPPDGAPSNVFNISDTAALHLAGIRGLAAANIAGTTYLFVASNTENAVSTFAVAADGSLVDMGSVVDTPALALSHAWGLETEIIGGQTFLAVTGMADSGVSLFRVDTTGLTITGTAAGETIDATHAPAGQLLPGELGDLVFGLGGNDVLAGLGGNDTLDGGDGTDRLDGGAGFDTLRGGAANDTYLLGNGADLVLDTGGTADQVTTTITRSLLAPGLTTIERLTLLAGNINGTGNNLANIIIGSTGNNSMRGGLGSDTLSGGGGNDTLHGDAGNDLLSGGTGDDKLYGETGKDTLSGSTGNDRLVGGAGRDIMTGGPGRDVFDFNAIAEIGKGAARDVIKDFTHGIDHIDLSTIDANGAAAGNGKFSLLAQKGAAFTGVHGQLHWLQVNAAGTAHDKTIVEGDINGDKVADFQLELSGLKTLAAGDFVL